MEDSAPKQDIQAYQRTKRKQHAGGRPPGKFFELKLGRSKLTTTIAHPVANQIDVLADAMELPRNRIIELAILHADWDNIQQTGWIPETIDIHIHDQLQG